jgi:hypothetical protein
MTNTWSTDILANAEALRDVLLWIANSSHLDRKFAMPMTVVGFSQGALFGRLGVHLYEKEIQGRYENSAGAVVAATGGGFCTGCASVGLYVSVDGPHQGAVLPQGVPWLLRQLGQEDGGEAAAANYNRMQGKAMSDMLIPSVSFPVGSSKTPGINDYILPIDEPKYDGSRHLRARQVGIANGNLSGEGYPKHTRTGVTTRKLFDINRDWDVRNLPIDYFTHHFVRWQDATTPSGEAVAGYKIDAPPGGPPDRNASLNSTAGDPYADLDLELAPGGGHDFVLSVRDQIVAGYGGVALLNGVNNYFEGDGVWLPNPSAGSTFIPTTSALDLFALGEPVTLMGGSMQYRDWQGARQQATTFDKTYGVESRYPETAVVKNQEHVTGGGQRLLWWTVCEALRLDPTWNQATLPSDCAETAIPGWFTTQTSRRELGLKWAPEFSVAGATLHSGLPTAGWRVAAEGKVSGTYPAGTRIQMRIQIPAGYSWYGVDLVSMKSADGTGYASLGVKQVKSNGYWQLVEWTTGIQLVDPWFQLILSSQPIAGTRILMDGPYLPDTRGIVESPTTTTTQTGPQLLPTGTGSSWVSGAWGSHTFSSTGAVLRFDRPWMGAVLWADPAVNLAPFTQLRVVFAKSQCDDAYLFFDNDQQLGPVRPASQNYAPKQFHNRSRMVFLKDAAWKKSEDATYRTVEIPLAYLSRDAAAQLFTVQNAYDYYYGKFAEKVCTIKEASLR